tara:strand:- start:285 stop:587 length:303 start_codon:yes stop_codon:yes gene_type:complete
MNIKLPSIAPPIKDVTVGKETNKQMFEGGGLKRTFENLLQEVNQQQLTAESKQVDLMVSENKDIHGTMLALEKADLSMRLMLQVRNKLVSAYEEIMRMQV